jgi:hypothetical protein
MPGRGPQTFKKRQKEQERKERQQEKMAKRLQRKAEKASGIVPADDDLDLAAPSHEEDSETEIFGSAAPGLHEGQHS